MNCPAQQKSWWHLWHFNLACLGINYFKNITKLLKIAIGRVVRQKYVTAVYISKHRKEQSVTRLGWKEYPIPHRCHQLGQICETILCEYLLREGYYIFRPPAAQGPVDVIGISEDGEIVLFDAKKDVFRVNRGRKKADRVYRARSPLQKKMGCRVAYVDVDTRNVHIVPPLTKPSITD